MRCLHLCSLALSLGLVNLAFAGPCRGRISTRSKSDPSQPTAGALATSNSNPAFDQPLMDDAFENGIDSASEPTRYPTAIATGPVAGTPSSQTPEATAAETTSQAANEAPDETPNKEPYKMPRKKPNQAPQEAPTETPTETISPPFDLPLAAGVLGNAIIPITPTTSRAASETPSEASNKELGGMLRKRPSQAPQETPTQTPSETLSQTATETPNGTLSETTSETPSQTLSQTTSDIPSETPPSEIPSATSCDATVVPTLTLPSPTPIYETGRYDDYYAQITLPFPVGVYSSFGTTVFVSTNGLVSLNSGSTRFSNEQLPNYYIPSVSILPYWDDLMLVENSGHGLYYDVFNSSRGRQATIEWIVTSFSDKSRCYHFSTTFYELYPGIVNTSYYAMTSNGDGATIGAQDLLNNKFIQYSHDTANSVPDGTYLVIDTTGGTGSTTTGRLNNFQC